MDGVGGLTLGGFNGPMPVTGTYSVNADCTFTVSITAAGGVFGGDQTGRVLGVLVDGGKRFYVCSTDPSRNQFFIGERQ